MRAWAFLLAGMIVWTVHFFAIYIVASVFLTTTIARVLTVVITLLCLGANGWLALRLRKKPGSEADGLTEWMRTIALAGVALSALSVLWQGLPALLV